MNFDILQHPAKEIVFFGGLVVPALGLQSEGYD